MNQLNETTGPGTDENIEQAFLQLTFAIKLLTYLELGRVAKEDFDGEVQIILDSGSVTFPTNSFNSFDDVILAAQNNYVITLGFTTIVLDTALAAAGLSSDLPDTSPFRDLRSLVRMLRCTFAHDMMRPRWEARGIFRRRMSVALPSGVLEVDVGSLDGENFHESQIGGIEKYLEIKEEVVRVIQEVQRQMGPTS